jgi:hypothetical protein
MQSTPTIQRWRARQALAAAVLLGMSACTPPVQNDTGMGFGNGTVAPPSENAGGTVPYKVIDTEGFDRPMTAFTMDIPAGWTVAAQMRWDNRNGQCSVDIASANIRLTSPDGSAQIEFLPGYMVSNYSDIFLNRGSRPGDYCVIAMADSGEKLVRDIALPQLRRGWTVESMTAVALPPSVKLLADAARSGGGNARVEPYAIETILRSPDGNRFEKLAMAGVAVTQPQIIEGLAPNLLNQNTQNWAVRGPRAQLGQLEATARAIMASVKADPEWQRAMSAFRERLARASQPRPPRGGSSSGGSSSGGSSSGGTDPGFDMGGWRRDQRRDDKEQERRVDGIREEEECVDPETGRRYTVSIHVGCPT